MGDSPQCCGARQGRGVKSFDIIALLFLTPPSLRATSPIAHACAEEVNSILMNSLCFLFLLRFYGWLPAMLRDTVGEKCRNLLTLSFFCFLTPPSLRATSPIAHTCAEEEVNASLLNSLCFLPPVSILCATPCCNTGHGWERGNMLNNNQLMSHYMYKRGQWFFIMLSFCFIIFFFKYCWNMKSSLS